MAKAPNEPEQALLNQMRDMKETGSSLRSIHKWLNDDRGVKLTHSSMRLALLALE